MFIPPVTIQTLYAAALWIFLAPLIIILGTADVLTGGRSRNWPFAPESHAG